ncbi:MAG: hypothetical protein ABL961_08085 [Vicinamibacterales bacterium]
MKRGNVTEVVSRGVTRAWRTIVVVALAALATPTAARAQSAIIYGSLGNFDIANDTGKVCHGFEIDIDGVQVSDVPGAFSSNRYGMPTITATPTGVAVRYQTTYNAASGQWATRTLPHTVPWFSGQCYQWVQATYENGGCEHFGSYSITNPTKVSSRWLCESDTDPAVLVLVDPPTAVPMPTYYVQAPAAANNPPELVVEVDAPEPAEVQGLFGNAQWIRVFKTELQRPVLLDELVADNPAVVPADVLAQLESDYSIMQDEPPAGGNGNRRRHRNQGSIAPTTRAVVRRIETWQFTGQYDPLTNEALCADLLCNAPAADEIGELISVQMSAANVQADSLSVTTAGKGTVESSDKLIACGSKCVQPYNAGTVVTLTAKAGSGTGFTGWNGACNNALPTCAVTVNGAASVSATFTTLPTTGGGGGGGGVGGGGGGGGSTSSFTLQVGKSNAGTVTATPSGDKAISCGKDCSAKYAAGKVVTLTAAPPVGKAFVNWGGACSTAGANSTCTISMTANQSVLANFSK